MLNGVFSVRYELNSQTLFRWAWDFSVLICFLRFVVCGYVKQRSCKETWFREFPVGQMDKGSCDRASSLVSWATVQWRRLRLLPVNAGWRHAVMRGLVSVSVRCKTLLDGGETGSKVSTGLTDRLNIASLLWILQMRLVRTWTRCYMCSASCCPCWTRGWTAFIILIST